MDPLDFKTIDELTRFFRCNKTVMSSMELPNTFLRQLRDHNLIPEDKYKKLIKMKGKQKKNGVYEVLEWLETTRPENISHFWKCVFKDHILQQYPTLRLLRDKLLGESSTSSGKRPEKKGTMEAGGGKGVKRKITGDGNKAENLEDAESSEEEQSGLLSKAAPMRKEKLGTSRCSSSFKKSKTEEIRICPKQQNIISVVCGDKKGSLYRDKLAKGEKCIKADERWFYPFEFEEYAGKKSSRNWKTSIRYQDTTLLKLIKDGDLTCGKFKPRRSQSIEDGHLTCGKFKRRRSQSIERPELKNQAEVSTSGSKSKRQRKEAGESPAGGAEAHDRGDGEKYVSHFAGNRLPVTCGSARGILHKDRFVSGSQGKCIRMEDKWVTPVDFSKENPTSGDSDWMSRILCSGKPLSDLLEKKVLDCHPPQCQCRLCTNQDQALREQDNDDDCFICDVPGCLLCCDQCPRAFHFECHVPAMTGGAADYRVKWICTYCVLKNTQGWRHPCEMTLQAALESPISARLLDCQYLLLCLYKEDKEKVLKGDPQHLASNYTKVIKEPMWFDKIAEKLQNKSYSTVGQFFSDVQLMFRNCASLSQGKYVKLATKLTSLFDEEFRKVFFIHR
ncbi:nuclear body protein SP140-like protein [Brienomyrus brachyistius]|uniref:nuclear body protein SP140-like protein n=1 Tax=Brienomyrus brachyistius TaxID=42636 RepID=UPI0020B4271C|nr:nuclear body protein SP140-like protein [Brienomyrus brachyistius]